MSDAEKIAAIRESARRSLPLFSAFLYGQPFLRTAFHFNYYTVLNEFAHGRIRRLIVSMPPQHGKSTGAAQLLPAYMLGIAPDTRIVIASYSASLASKFNRRVQGILESPEYAFLFPESRIKQGQTPPNTIRTRDEVEIVGRSGSLLSVGREGSLTGNPADCFILDDLYKDALEANSPLIRANCWEWYTSVVRTRMHNASRELIVFTRWHEEDLIGTLAAREPVEELRDWRQLDTVPPDTWLHLNFEALKASPPSQIDPREAGEALWPEQHSEKSLREKRKLDPHGFECLYQGHPSDKSGALYGEQWQTYTELPATFGNRNYTDIADTGTDKTLSISYRAGALQTENGQPFRLCYVTDVVYTGADLTEAETLLPMMFARSQTRAATIESNNGGAYFGRTLRRLCPAVAIDLHFQSQNKEARIMTYAPTVKRAIVFPADWKERWPEFYHDVVTFKAVFRANAHDEAADVLTGICEQEFGDLRRSRGVKRRN